MTNSSAFIYSEIKNIYHGNTPKKIGLLSGRFDPPHYGHFNLAERSWTEVFHCSEKSEIWLRPHMFNSKPGYSAPLEERIEMLKLGLKGRKGKYRIIPFSEDYGSLYNFYRLLKDQLPQTEIFLVRGTDHIKKYARDSPYLGVPHVIWIREDHYCELSKLNWKEKIPTAKDTWLPVSSSWIKSQLQTGRDRRLFEKYLPSEIVDYIYEKKLYGISERGGLNKWA